MPFLTQGKTNWKFLLIVVVAAAIAGGGALCFLQQQTPSYQTIELKIPEKKSNEECQKYTEAECPEGCIVCPPCEECSSLGCYSAEYCKSMGFDESWYEMIKLQRETADWQTYRNEEYGFEFKYPEEFDKFEPCKLKEEDNFLGSGSFFIGLGSRFSILISDSKGLSLSEYVMKEKEEALYDQAFPPPEEAWHQEDIYVVDIKGIKATWFHGPRYSQIIYLLKDNIIFEIGWTAGTGCLDYYLEPGLSLEINELEVFEQIPNTFRFIEESEVAEDMTIEELENAEYYIRVFDKNVEFKSGNYEERVSESGAEFTITAGIYPDFQDEESKYKIAFGDLNNDGKDDAAVIIFSNTGGSGSWIDLTVILNSNGGPIFIDSAPLGDRTRINSIIIDEGIITLDIITHSQEDPMCCPTLEKTVKYKLSEGRLVEI